MKITYKTPEIAVEELAKVDVLCDSDPTLGQDNSVNPYSGTAGSGSGFDFDTGSLLTP